MGSELARRPVGTPVGRGFGKALRTTNGYQHLERLDEQHRAAIVAGRIDNSIYLAQRGMVGLTNLNGLATALSKDNPGLELELRHIEEGVAMGIRNTVVNYMMGR